MQRATRSRYDLAPQIRRATARGYDRLAVLACAFVELHYWAQGVAVWAVALDMALCCAVILVIHPTKALMSEVPASETRAAGRMPKPQPRHDDRSLASGHKCSPDAAPVAGLQICLTASWTLTATYVKNCVCRPL